MKKLIILLAVSLMLVTPLAAKEKSAAKAMLFSAMVPGTGQAYLGSYTKAGVFMATEILTLGAAIRLSSEVDWAEKSYKQYALSQKGTPISNNNDHYQLMQNYVSSARYNAQMEEDAWAYFVLYYNDLASYHAYIEENAISEDEAWDWGTNSNWQEYRSKRRYRQDIKTLSNLAVAAVFLNHLTSLIDTALTNANLKKKKINKGRVNINPNLNKKRLSVGYAIKF